MKRIISLISVLVLVNVSLGQSSQPLDTIYANEKMNLALFFPTNIRQGIVGAENYIFTYNREKAQSLGLLKATKGPQSNLLVITTDGTVYSYLIRYAQTLKEMNRFISITESIGQEQRKVPKSTKDTSEQGLDSSVTMRPKNNYTKDFLDKSCISLLKQPERKNISRRKNGMSLSIKNMIYYEDLVFMQFEIKNDSWIDFEIDALETIKVNGDNKRKASFQETILHPVHTYGMPKKVRIGVTARFIYVLKKYTLGKSEKLKLRMKEFNGDRDLLFTSTFK